MSVDVRFCWRVALAAIEPAGLSPETLDAMRATASLVQVDPSALSARTATPLLRALRGALPTAIPVIAEARCDLALAAGLDGVLLGPDDLTAGDARRLLGRTAVLGVLLRQPAEADELYRWRTDYAVVCGPAGEPPSPERLSRIAFRVRLASPGTAVAALADVDVAPARLVAAGATGFAVSGGAALDEASARDLLARIDVALPRTTTA